MRPASPVSSPGSPIPPRDDSAAVEAIEDWLIATVDKDYYEVFGRLVAPDTPEAARAELMADLVARPNPLRLPYLVQLSSLSNHPYRADAVAILLSELGVNYGSNTLGWADAVKAHLESNSGVAGVELLLERAPRDAVTSP